MEAQLLPFLTLVFDGGEWSASCHSCVTSGERVPGMVRIELGGGGGGRAVPDTREKIQIPWLFCEITKISSWLSSP
jgi:hypothetical protein